MCGTISLAGRPSILGPGKGHKAYEGNRTRPRLTRCDLFDNGELLWRMARPERHDEPTTHFELLNQRRWDMVKCRRHDHCVERTAFRPSKITVTNFDSQYLRSRFGQWWDNLNGTDLSNQTCQYCGLVTRPRADFQSRYHLT